MMVPSLSHPNPLAIAPPSGAGRGERRESSSAAGSSWSWTAGASSARWLQEWRRRLDEVHLRGLECFAEARLGIGGPTLAQAKDCARRLIELAPYRETGHRLLIEALERRGNVAEALLAYDRLRVLLRDELGVAPSPAVQSVHRRRLDERTTAST